jgi:hypothetical protein
MNNKDERYIINIKKFITLLKTKKQIKQNSDNYNTNTLNNTKYFSKSFNNLLDCKNSYINNFKSSSLII